ncbi:MAG: hypothetical protein HZC02_01595 [Candidatus Levybacteria bacterium]|nr:hypothetical protein [Candidatus Levybacteria bacterium]
MTETAKRGDYEVVACVGLEEIDDLPFREAHLICLIGMCNGSWNITYARDGSCCMRIAVTNDPELFTYSLIKSAAFLAQLRIHSAKYTTGENIEQSIISRLKGLKAPPIVFARYLWQSTTMIIRGVRNQKKG